MTSAMKSTLTQLCQLERIQFPKILSLAQTNPKMASYLLSGNRNNFVLFLKMHISGFINVNIIVHIYTDLKRKVLTKYHFFVKVYYIM